MTMRNLGYAASTGLSALVFLAGGVFDLTRAPEVMAAMSALGYPAYVASLLGVWKVLGALTIALPRLPRLKEWAYAGMFFDLTGAAVSHACAGDPVAKVVTPLVILTLVLASWALRPKERTLRVVDLGFGGAPQLRSHAA